MADAPEYQGEEVVDKLDHVERVARIDVNLDTLVFQGPETILSSLRVYTDGARVRIFSVEDCADFGALLHAALASLPKELRYDMRLKRTANTTDGVKNSDELIYWKGRIVVRRTQTRFDYGPSIATPGEIRRNFGDSLKEARWRPKFFRVDESKVSRIESNVWFAPLDLLDLMPPKVVHERNRSLFPRAKIGTGRVLT